MVELRRTVRFCLNGPGGAPNAPRSNAFSSWPPMQGLGRYYELHVACRGDADPVTGYFINITQIDAAVRAHALPILAEAVEGNSAETALGELLIRIVRAIDAPLSMSIWKIGLQLTPYLAVEIEKRDMNHVTLRQQYEFSAAHRLHVASLGDERNREIFGKCNNPAGHGHNYKVEVAVRVPLDLAGRTPSVGSLDDIVDRAAIQKLDHKHLNLDVPAFAEGKLNPSVENISRVIFEMLAPDLKNFGGKGGKLEEVSVWETGKTVCTYRGAESSKAARV